MRLIIYTAKVVTNTHRPNSSGHQRFMRDNFSK